MAAIAWSPASAGSPRSVKGVCAAVNDTFAAAAGDGLLLDGVSAVDIHVEADLTRTITTAIQLQFHLQSPISGLWNRAPSLDMANASGVTTVRGQFMGTIAVPSAGRLGCAASAGAVSAGGLTITLIARNSKGRLV